MIQIDMPMPEGCDVCPLMYDYIQCNALPEGCEDDDAFNEEGFDWTKRPEWCPLKEQEPTTFKPHYIDKYSKHFICGVECGSCHKEISSTYHYCPYCGKEVKWE